MHNDILEKTCSRCKTKKSIDEFYSRDSRCKECVRLARKDYRSMPGFKEKARRWARNYYKSEGFKDKRKRYLLSVPEKVKQWNKNREEKPVRKIVVRRWRQSVKGKQTIHRWYLANTVKFAARTAVSQAVKSGRMVRPNACARCKVTCKPQGHHYLGYSREHWRDVEWLCRKCHKVVDALASGNLI